MFQTYGILMLLLSAVLYAAPVQQQEEPSPPTVEPNIDFVSGTVAELPPGKIVVNRAVLGKPAENRIFLIDEATVVEGRLRPRVRVTVGFKQTEDGEPVAVRIIVRPQTPNPKKQ